MKGHIHTWVSVTCLKGKSVFEMAILRSIFANLLINFLLILFDHNVYQRIFLNGLEIQILRQNFLQK